MAVRSRLRECEFALTTLLLMNVKFDGSTGPFRLEVQYLWINVRKVLLTDSAKHQGYGYRHCKSSQFTIGFGISCPSDFSEVLIDDHVCSVVLH